MHRCNGELRVLQWLAVSVESGVRRSSPCARKPRSASAFAATPSERPLRRWPGAGGLGDWAPFSWPYMGPLLSVFCLFGVRLERQMLCDSSARLGTARHGCRSCSALGRAQDMQRRLRPLRDAELLKLSSRTLQESTCALHSGYSRTRNSW